MGVVKLVKKVFRRIRRIFVREAAATAKREAVRYAKVKVAAAVSAAALAAVAGIAALVPENLTGAAAGALSRAPVVSQLVAPSVGDAVVQKSKGRYEATEWSSEEYPLYYRVAGAAVTDHDLQKGQVVYSGWDSLGRTGFVASKVTYKMVEASAGWRQEWPSDGSCDTVSGWGHNGKVTISLPNGRSYSGYMYNRSHLLADSLGGDARKDNIVTGTRTQNVGANSSANPGGMAYAETLARDWLYVHRSGYVYYCATPVYVGDELVPRSVYVDIRTSDGSVNQHVEVFNCAEGYKIDYMTGKFSKVS